MRPAPVLLLAALAALAPVVSGCATMIHGTTQEVPITSEPPGADVRLRGATVGTTPTTLTLDRKPDYDLEITRPGFRAANVRLESVSQYDASSVLLGGLVGWGIDSSTGGNKRLYPERVHVVLTPDTTTGEGGERTPIEAQLRRLEELRSAGKISDEEHAVMRRRLIEQVTPAMLNPAAPPPPATAETPGRWLLGVWEGEHIARGITEDQSDFTFTDEGAGIRWTLSRATVIGQRRLHLGATGRVVTVTESSVELEGRYTVHPTAHGAGIRYSLARRGGDLTGTWIGSQNQVYEVSIKRKMPR